MTSILMDVFYFYKRNWVPLLIYIVSISLIMSTFSLFVSDMVSSGDEMEKAKTLIVLNFFMNPIYLGGFIYLLSGLSQNRNLGIKQCLGLGLYKWFALFTVSIFYGVLTGLGLFLFILPGLWIFMRLILSSFIVVLNNKTPFEALTESFKATEEHFWNIAGTTSLIFLSLILIQQFIITILPDTMAMTILSSVIGDILWSVLTILWFRFYDLLINNN